MNQTQGLVTRPWWAWPWARLNGWRSPPHNEQRWLMVDVETSGLAAQKDELLAIAALALVPDWQQQRLLLDPADSFEIVVRPVVPPVLGPPTPSGRENILVHGLGVQTQQGGTPPAQALAAFAEFAGHSPLLAFHAAFDQAVLSRAMQQALGMVLPNPWLDVAALCAVAQPKQKAKALDEWLDLFAIICPKRHQASADVWVQALLLQRLWPQLARACRGRRANWAGLRRLANQGRWLA